MRLATKCMGNVGLGITFVQRAREINQLAVQFGCILVVAQPHNPKLRNNLDDFAFSSPSVLWLNRTNYFGFWASMQRKPRFMQVNTFDKVVAGFLLFLVFTRARFADALRDKDEPVVEGQWVRASVKEYKASKARDRRGRELPLAGPAKVAGLEWAASWLRVRNELGLKVSPLRPLLTKGDRGMASQAAMDNAELNQLLRGWCKDAVVEADLAEEFDFSTFGTHSCKRTGMHWLAAAGVDLDTRRLLGHHVLRSDGSWLAYSHDAMQVPLTKFADVVEKVFASELKVFGADARGQDAQAETQEVAGGMVTEERMAGAVPPVEAEVVNLYPVDVSETPKGDEDLSDSSSGSSCQDSDDENLRLSSEIAEAEPAERMAEIATRLECQPWCHSVRGTLHIRRRLATSDVARLVCGKVLGDQYEEVDGWSRWPRCHRCFQSVPELDLLD